MTNRLSWLMVVFLATIFGLTACGGDNQPDAAQGAESFVSMMSAEVSPMSTSANTTVTADMTMDWAERTFPELFPRETADLFPAIVYEGVTYNARAYVGLWETSYLGITEDRRIFGLGAFTGGVLQQFETIDYWADQVLADQNGGGDTDGGNLETLLFEKVIDFRLGSSRNHDTRIYSVSQTSDGGYIFSGGWREDQNPLRSFIVKTDAKGEVIWTKLDQRGELFSIIELDNGDFIATGSYNPHGAFDYGFNRDYRASGHLLYRLDREGNVLWEFLYKGYQGDKAGLGDMSYSVKQTSNGNFIIAGRDDRFVARASDGYMALIDENGSLIWEKLFGYGLFETFRAVDETFDGGFIAAGFVISSGYGSGYLVRTDIHGNPLWEKWIRKGQYDDIRINSIKTTSDGNFIIAGKLNFNTYLALYSEDGEVVWEVEIPQMTPNSVIEADDGDFVIAGTARVLVSGTRRNYASLLRTDSVGNIKWQGVYTGNGTTTEAFSVIQTEDGGFIIAAINALYNFSAYFIKTDENGGTGDGGTSATIYD